MPAKRRRIGRYRSDLPEALAAWDAGLPPLDRAPLPTERQQIAEAAYGLSEFSVLRPERQPHTAAWLDWATSQTEMTH